MHKNLLVPSPDQNLLASLTFFFFGVHKLPATPRILAFFPVVLMCRVSFWFWQEIGFSLHTHILRVQYSCGVVLVFWLQREIVYGVMYILSVQYSCAVVSVFGSGGK